MEFFRPFTFLVILSESIALLPKNPALITFIFVSSLLLHSSLSFFFTRTVLRLFRTRFQPSIPDPSSLLNFPDLHPFISAFAPAADAAPEIGLDFSHHFVHFRQDLAVVLAVQLAFVLAFSVVSFFSTLSTVIVSAVSYKSRALSFRSLFASIWRAWPRLLVTCFYVSSFTLGYTTIVVAVASPLLIYLNFSTISIVATSIVALIFFLYLLVAFALSLVVSVIEENCYGLEALGKAAGLIKGERVHGFFLNICFNAVVLGVYQICRTTAAHGRLSQTLISQLVLTNVGVLVKIFMDIAYTVLYFHCKKDHGEEIELYGSLQYGRLPTTMLTDDDEDLP